MTTIPPKNYPEYDYTSHDVNGDETIDAKDEQAWFDNKANCEIIGGKVGGKMDPTRRAYYYKITYCTNKGCEYASDGSQGYLDVEKVYLDDYYPDITEGTRFYMIEADSNVVFLSKDGVTPLNDTKLTAADFHGVVLKDCSMGGYYLECVASKDFEGDSIEFAYSVVERHPVPKGHQWMDHPLAVPANNSQFTDFSSKTVKYGNNTYLVPTKNGDEWIVKSKNCSTDAYYELKMYCLSPFCKYYLLNDQPVSDPEYVGGIKKAVPGDHDWFDVGEKDPETGELGRRIDPSLTEYFYVDEQHHREQYWDFVKCKLCGATGNEKSTTPDALVEHTFAPKELNNGSKVDATCGTPGSYQIADTCVCYDHSKYDENTDKDKIQYYYDEDTVSTVTIPATDDHDFGDNPAVIVWSGGTDIDGDGIGDGKGAVYIADQFVEGVSLHADIVRKCNKCGKYDSNGINTMIQGSPEGNDVEVKGSFDRNSAADHWDETTRVPAGKWCAKLRVDHIDPAKKDPATGIAYRCSTAHATISVDWVGTVDGEVKYLNSETCDNAVKTDVPYYESVYEYQARTSHTPGAPHKEGDQIVRRCTVCGDIVSQEDDNTPSVGVPTVTAASVDFDTVNVSWTKVEGATAYRLYYRSSDEGISKWAKIRTFTGDTTSYAVNGLTTGSKYRFTVRAEVTQDGKTTLGDYSKKGAVAVPKLTAPEIKSVTASGKTTKVTWSRVDGASGYIVFRNSQRVGTVTKGSKVTWTDKKPVSGAKYQVRAYRTEAKKNFKSDLSEPK